ncbi:carboxylate--amine ligase [Natronolimnohabitans innermongolicus]|uniref:ATP-grasp domain-containing protein n=1 Tax=Natronolimnohabitans innermongolicus JCM 12255 TaxID=1227499 RepID=L9X2D7_9EURY|nr:hypothetical protein [Natronolimnohabitans innermongolicus]ELY54753.1 hypothetical protein C493_12309 [Natronolimnohabitans innermongolicus JCM 12255]
MSLRRDEDSAQSSSTDSVVVPAVPVPSTESCLRSLSAAGVRTIVVSDDRTAPSFASAYCDEAVLVPDPETALEGYAEALLALARREDVRTIVPVREEDAFVLSRYREEFAEHVATPWPDPESLRSVHDRVRLAEAAERAGVPVPETRPLSTVDDWDSDSIVKTRYNLLVDEYVDGVPSNRVERNKTVEHVSAGSDPDVDALRESFGHDPIAQEFVPIDEEYMIGALYDHGEAVATFQHRQLRGSSYTGGGGVYREATAIPELEDAAVALLDELEWHGLACIEYMRHPETGEFYLCEINPRMWTSLAANVRMGADFPAYYWQLATDRADEIDDSYDVGAGSHYVKGELLYLSSLFRKDSDLVDRPSLPETLREMAASWYRHPTSDTFQRDDPWPFVQSYLMALDRASASLPAPLDGLEPSALGRWLSGATEPVHWREAAGSAPAADRTRGIVTEPPP